MKTTVLLINLGTPNSPKVSSVRKYLSEFLNDSRVIDLPWLFRKMLVNLIIVPFRSFKSARLYKEVWTKEGSPLLTNTNKLSKALKNELSNNYHVEMAMRYGKPSLSSALKRIKENETQRIILLPLFPQYASSTTASILEKSLKIMSKWQLIPDIKTLHHFHDHPGFIEAFSQRIATYKPQNYDHIIVSFHGLPLNQVNAAHGDQDCETMSCSSEINDNNYFCYRASCYETSRLLAEKLNLQEDEYTVCFQSRFSKNWTRPFTDEVVFEQIEKGNKRLLILSPSFVTDCLETLHELGQELKKGFEQKGGEELTLVNSLNDDTIWVQNLAKMIEKI